MLDWRGHLGGGSCAVGVADAARLMRGHGGGGVGARGALGCGRRLAGGESGRVALCDNLEGCGGEGGG